MPAQLWLEDGVLCPYMSFHELDRVPSNTLESVISAAPVPASWTRHSSVVSSHNDNTWFPSALSYGKSCFFVFAQYSLIVAHTFYFHASSL